MTDNNENEEQIILGICWLCSQMSQTKTWGDVELCPSCYDDMEQINAEVIALG